MNFLGHAYFSPDNHEILAANVFGDFVKGRIENHDLPENIKNGLKLHRELDSYCNTCKAYISIKNEIGDEFGHYKSVIADIFIDHLLCAYWKDFSSIPINIYSELTYSKIQKSSQYFPEMFKRVFEYMKNDNWFVISKEYGYIENILRSIERRSPRGIAIAPAVNILKLKKTMLKGMFYEFMDEMKNVL